MTRIALSLNFQIILYEFQKKQYVIICYAHKINKQIKIDNFKKKAVCNNLLCSTFALIQGTQLQYR